MSSSSPLAAQTGPASRTLDSTNVEPNAEVTVTITIADDYTGTVARVTETLGAGLSYVDGSANLALGLTRTYPTVCSFSRCSA